MYSYLYIHVYVMLSNHLSLIWSHKELKCTIICTFLYFFSVGIPGNDTRIIELNLISLPAVYKTGFMLNARHNDTYH